VPAPRPADHDRTMPDRPLDRTRDRDPGDRQRPAVGRSDPLGRSDGPASGRSDPPSRSDPSGRSDPLGRTDPPSHSDPLGRSDGPASGRSDPSARIDPPSHSDSSSRSDHGSTSATGRVDPSGRRDAPGNSDLSGPSSHSDSLGRSDPSGPLSRTDSSGRSDHGLTSASGRNDSSGRSDPSNRSDPLRRSDPPGRSDPSGRNDHSVTSHRESRQDVTGDRSRDSRAVPDRQPVKTSSSTPGDGRTKPSSAVVASGQPTASTQPRSTIASSMPVRSDRTPADKSSARVSSSHSCLLLVEIMAQQITYRQPCPSVSDELTGSRIPGSYST